MFSEDVYNWMGRDRGSWIPLIVCSCNGGAFNSTTSVKKLASDDKRQFAANYAQSQFIFTHQFEKKFVIDRYITMSENSLQIEGYLMESWILFIGDTLVSIEETEEFHSFSWSDYNNWK